MKTKYSQEKNLMNFYLVIILTTSKETIPANGNFFNSKTGNFKIFPKSAPIKPYQLIYFPTLSLPNLKILIKNKKEYNS